MDALTDVLFAGLNDQTPPHGLANLDFGMDIFNVQFDQMQNVLQTRVKLFYQWSDPKMVWEPENYENISEYVTHYNDAQQCWLPILKFPDGVGLKNVDSSEASLKVTMHHNGTTNASSKHLTVSTWCTVGSAKVWPHEQVTCHLNVSLANAFGVHLRRMTGHAATVQQSENSPWTISWVDMTLLGEQITYTISLKRNESFIDSLFGTPLHFVLAMLMCSVFVRQSMYRVFLVMLAALVLLGSFITLTKRVPPFYTPLIGNALDIFQTAEGIEIIALLSSAVQYYCVALVLVVFGLICHIVSQHLGRSTPQSQPPRWIVAASENRVFSYLCCVVPEPLVRGGYIQKKGLILN